MTLDTTEDTAISDVSATATPTMLRILPGAASRALGPLGARAGLRALTALRAPPRSFSDAALARHTDELTDLHDDAAAAPRAAAAAQPVEPASKGDGGKAYREEHEVSLDGTLVGCNTAPLVSFADVVALLDSKSRPLAKRAAQTFKDLGYTTPSVIQAQSWPLTLEGRDCIGVSKTGSGKTMAFMLPAVAKVVAKKAELVKQRKLGPYVVVLAPTRELAQQIFAEAEKLTKPNGLGIVCTYGGESRSSQSMRVMRASRAKQFDVLVSTPGRLQDLLDDSTVVLDGTQMLVLDEADRMLDMGFEPQIRAIVESMPPPERRQTLLFSATWPREVKHLALDFTHDAIKVTIGSTDELSANRDITQTIVPLGGAVRNKLEELLRLLKQGAGSDGEAAPADTQRAAASGERGGGRGGARYDDVPQTLVFANRKSTCDELESMLLDERIRCSALHGDLTQRRRENVIEMFKASALAVQRREGDGGEGIGEREAGGHARGPLTSTLLGVRPALRAPPQARRVNVIVATDVAARGLDIKGLDMVVNYDFPPALEDYVHRIGRTGRAGRKGVAVSFFGKSDAKLAPKLIELLKKHEQEVPQELQAMVPRGGGSSQGDYGRYGYGRRPVSSGRGGYGSRFGRDEPRRDGGRFGGDKFGRSGYSYRGRDDDSAGGRDWAPRGRAPATREWAPKGARGRSDQDDF